jgi:hypothetical protein
MITILGEVSFDEREDGTWVWMYEVHNIQYKSEGSFNDKVTAEHSFHEWYLKVEGYFKAKERYLKD